MGTDTARAPALGNLAPSTTEVPMSDPSNGMSDMTKCEGGECPLRFRCWRFVAPGDFQWQSWFAYPPRGRNAIGIGGCSQFDDVVPSQEYASSPFNAWWRQWQW